MTDYNEVTAQSSDDVKTRVPGRSRPFLFIATWSIMCNSFLVGCLDGMLGPVIPDIALRTSSSIEFVAFLYTWKGVASILGSPVWGWIFDKLNFNLTFLLAIVGSVVFHVAIPFCTDVIVMQAMAGISALFIPALYLGPFPVAFDLWGEAAAPVVQGIRVVVSCAFTVAPIVAGFFIATTAKCGEAELNATLELLQNASAANSSDVVVPVCGDRIEYAFLLVAVVGGIFALQHVVLFFCGGKVRVLKEKKKRSEKEVERRDSKTERFLMSRDYISKFKFLSVAMVFLAIHGGIDVSITGILTSYVHKYLKRSLNDGIYMTTVFQASKCFGCLLAMFVSNAVKPRTILAIDVVCLIIGSILLAFLLFTHHVVIWLAVMFLGLGISNIYSSIAAWYQERFPLTGLVSAVFNISFCTGFMILPTIAAILLRDYGLMAMPYLFAAGTLVMTLLFPAMVWFMKAAMAELAFIPVLIKKDVKKDKQGSLELLSGRA